jgi:hypothetical protein
MSLNIRPLINFNLSTLKKYIKVIVNHKKKKKIKMS